MIELTEQELIELAKQAAPVPVSVLDSKKEKVADAPTNSKVLEFLDKLGLKPGRNEVPKSNLFEMFNQFFPNEMSNKIFYREIGKIFKSNSTHFKCNMKLITAEEKLKEILNGKEETRST